MFKTNDRVQRGGRHESRLPSCRLELGAAKHNVCCKGLKFSRRRSRAAPCQDEELTAAIIRPISSQYNVGRLRGPASDTGRTEDSPRTLGILRAELMESGRIENGRHPSEKETPRKTATVVHTGETDVPVAVVHTGESKVPVAVVHTRSDRRSRRC